MTGAFVRIKRDGKWQNVEIDQLTDSEFREFRKDQPVEKGWVWAEFLAHWIRDHIAL